MPVFNVVSQLEITGDQLELWLPRVMCLSERKFDKSLKMALLWFPCTSHGKLFISFFQDPGVRRDHENGIVWDIV